MKVIIGNKKRSISLSDNDFLNSGGQANIYAKDKFVYKIYHDPLELAPNEKIYELMKFQNDNVVMPENLIYNQKSKERLGLVFRWLKNCLTLHDASSNGYWRDHRITKEVARDIVIKIQSTISKTHKAGFLIVDLNPLNILIKQGVFDHFFIDTESWQTKNHPATAIMPNIRDPKTKKFSKLTDWYSFAVISCEFFLGIHPFKGIHPDFGKPNDVQKRMQAGASIFDKGVKLNRVRDFSVIPANYRDWYCKVFKNDERIPPPEKAGNYILKDGLRKIVSSTDKLSVELLKEYPGEILSHHFVSGKRIIILRNQIFIDDNSFPFDGKPVLSYDNKILFVKSTGNEVKVFIPEISQEKVFPYNHSQYMISNNKLFLKQNAHLNQVEIYETGSSFFFLNKSQWPIMPKSTTLFNGCCIQNVLGKKYVLIPGYSNIRIPELDSVKVVTVTRQHNIILAVVVDNLSNMQRLLFIFNDNYSKYTFESEKTENKDVNIALLKNKSLIVSLEEGGKIEIHSLLSAKSKIIYDDKIDPNWVLSTENDNVVFFDKNKLYKLSSE